MNVDERGDAIGGIPKLRLLVVLEYYLGVPWASPSLGSSHSLFRRPSKLHPKLGNLTTQKLNRELVRSLSIIKQIIHFGTAKTRFIIFLTMPTLPYHFYNLY